MNKSTGRGGRVVRAVIAGAIICAGMLSGTSAIRAAEPTAPAAAEETPPAKPSRSGGWFKGALDALRGSSGTGAESANGAAGELSTDTIVAGLKRGLDTGVDRALAELGKPDGFFANAAFKIPLPAELAKGEKLLRKAGQDKLADDLVLALNRAAEKSVAETTPIFKEAITGMTLADAREILEGPKDAATKYFRSKTEEALRGKMMPIVKAATDANGVGAAYKQFAGKAAPVASLFGSKAASLDLDRYVCDRALDSLFKVIATQEAQLRANPAAATEDLLRKVFGAVKKA